MRHGRPEIDLTARQYEQMSALDIKQIIDDYQDVGLATTQSISDEARAIAASCSICVTSDIVRAIESAELLNANNIMAPDSIFREIDLPHPDRGTIKFSMKFWLVILRLLWFFGYKNNGESITDSRDNAKIGAMRLAGYAHKFDSVLLVGHGINIHLIAKQLKRLGWTGSSDWTRDYWSFNQFELD